MQLLRAKTRKRKEAREEEVGIGEIGEG